MCIACRNLAAQLTPADVAKIDLFFGLLLAHFITIGEDGDHSWDGVTLGAVLTDYIDSPEIRDGLGEHSTLQNIFNYGGMCALDMIANTITRAREQVLEATESDLSLISEALKDQ